MIGITTGIIIGDRERSIHSPESLLPETARFPGGSFHLTIQQGAIQAPTIAEPLLRGPLPRIVPRGASSDIAGEANLLVQQRRLAVCHEAVRQAHPEDARRGSCVVERLPDGRAEATGQSALLDRHQ
jgi:hypothetical protein